MRAWWKWLNISSSGRTEVVTMSTWAQYYHDNYGKYVTPLAHRAPFKWSVTGNSCADASGVVGHRCPLAACRTCRTCDGKIGWTLLSQSRWACGKLSIWVSWATPLLEIWWRRKNDSDILGSVFVPISCTIGGVSVVFLIPKLWEKTSNIGCRLKIGCLRYFF